MRLARLPGISRLFGLTRLPGNLRLSGLTRLPGLTRLSGISRLVGTLRFSGSSRLPNISILSGISRLTGAPRASWGAAPRPGRMSGRRGAFAAGLLAAPAVIALSTLSGATQEAGAVSAAAAMLVADRVFLEGQDRLIAEGNVEALQDGTRLNAARIVFDRKTGRLDVSGPVTITDRDAETVVLADAAELDRDLRNGLIRGARLVMGQQLQLAAYQLDRAQGRYSQLYKATVSSCKVCADGAPPLWQIRAERVVHDQQEQQLYFDNAQFQVMGVPVFWFPRLRLPDPTLTRATGFLIPSIRRNSQLGTGVRIPYFIRMGTSRDLTLTPYLSQETRTLEFRYRQEFRSGGISVEGAISNDDLAPAQPRVFVEAEGRFALPLDFGLSFDIEAVRDDAYVTDYGYSDKDRLDSEIAITRARRDEYIGATLTHYHTLRVTEDNATIPSIIGDLSYERRHFPTRLGGELRFGVDAHTHYRSSDLSVDGPDADTIVDGRDVSRLSLDAAWRRTWTLTMGMRAEAQTGVAVDTFRTAQDSALPAAQTGLTPRAALTLRWPWRRLETAGAVQVIEPVAQWAWAGGSDLAVANDESTRVEFDEGNLLSLSRFPAADRRERGHRLALGVNWTRLSTDGWETGATLGKILRTEPDADFTRSSGLTGETSDLLIAGQIRTPAGLSLTARGIFHDKLDVTKAEARATLLGEDNALAASYVWLGPDPAENRANVVSEMSVDGSFGISRHWAGSANWRYDIASDTTAEAGVGVQYTNECVRVELSASRRFTSSTIVTPSTDFSFTVGLRGFTARTDQRSYSRTCK